MGKNYLIEVTPVKPDGQLATIRMSRRGVSNAGVNLDNKAWLPLLETLPTFSLNLMSSGQLQIPTISYGDLEFICSKAYGNEEWSSYDWSNALASCWYGEDGDPFSQYTQVFSGRVSGFNRQEIYASVALLGSEADLQRPALFDEYEGTGGLEGGAGIKGTLKPRAHGFCRTVSPVQIDTVYLVYQVHGYGPIAGISKVYDFAQELDPAIANVSTYNELIALDLQPGQWATCNAHGLFRLGGSTDKKLTCDVMGALFNGVYTNTVKTITQQLIREVQPTAVFGTFGPFADAEWCFYAKDATSVADIVYRAVYEAGGYLIPDGAGRWQVGDFYAPVNRGQLRSDRSTLPLVISHEEKSSTGPVWKVSVGHSRCWSKHTESEISPTIFDASGLASTEDLEDALEELANVRADITLQLSRLDAMAADGVLDRAEKKYWEQEYARQIADRNKLVVDGSQFDVSAEIAAYQGAATYLTNYLNGLLPAWNDGTQDTPIDRVAFKAAWESLYSAKLALTQKMTGQASEKAIWDKIIGSGKPEDGATVGAPIGTFVGGTPASTIAAATVNFNTRNDRNGAAIVNPTIATNGSAIDHTINTDGSADISFEWLWSGNNSDIDGFTVVVLSSTSSAAYTLGTTPADETVYTIIPEKRACFLYGVPANRYYTFYVQAYRVVDPDINSAGVIRSTAVKSTASGENPYRPSATVAFAGNITGTVNGVAASTVSTWGAIIDAAKAEIQQISTEVTADFTEVNQAVDALQGDVSTAQSNISGLQSTTSAVQSGVSTLNGQMTTAQGNITSLQSSTSSLNTSVSTLNNQMTTAQGSISTLQNSVGSLNTNVSGLQIQASGIVTSVSGLDTRITAQGGQINTMNSTLTSQGSSITTLQQTVSNTSGEVATLKTQINAGGGNLLTNTDLALDTSGWDFSPGGTGSVGDRVATGDQWVVTGENGLRVTQANGTTSSYADWSQIVPVEAGKWYDVSARIAAHRCSVILYIQWIDADGVALASAPNISTTSPLSGGNNLANWTQVGFKAQAPASAVRGRMILRKMATNSGANPATSYAWYIRPQVTETQATSSSPLAYSPGNARATITTQATAVSTLNSTVSTLSSTVSTQGGSITSLQSSVTTLQGSVSTLSSTVSTQGASISSLQTSVSTAQGDLATLKTQINAGGGNLLVNTDLALDTTGWTFGTNNGATFGRNLPSSSWYPANENTLVMVQANATTTGNSDITQIIEISAGKWYDVSVYAAQHRCSAELIIQWLDSAGNANLGAPSSGQFAATGGGSALSSFVIRSFKAQAPAGAVRARFYLRKMGTNSGQTDSYAWFLRPQVVETLAGSATPIAYSPGSARATIVQQASALSTLNTSFSSLSSTVSSQGGSVATLQSSMTSAQGSISTLQSTVSSQGANISTLQSTTSTQTGQIASLNSTVSTQGSSISSLQSTVSSQGSSLSTLNTIVTASSNPNLVQNGGFENGIRGWTGGGRNPNNWSQQNWVWGYFAHNSNAWTGSASGNYAYLDCAPFGVADNGNTLTMSFDVDFTAGAGSVAYGEVVWLNSSGSFITQSSTQQVGPRSFDVTGNGRVKGTVSAPVGASTAYARVVFYAPNGVTMNSMNIRHLKVEFGSNATPYSGEATAGQMYQAYATLDSSFATLSTTVASQGGSISTLQSSFTGLNGTVSTLNSTVSAQGSSISSLQSASSTQSGQISTLQTQVRAGGGNLLNNTDFGVDTAGWSFGTSNGSVGDRVPSGDPWIVAGENGLRTVQLNTNSANQGDWTQEVAIEEGKWYDASVYAASHRANIQVYLQFINASGTVLATPSSGLIGPAGGGSTLANFVNRSFKGLAPAGAVKAKLYLRKFGTLSGSDSYAWFLRPQITETTATSASPVSYSPGSVRASISVQNSAISTLTSQQATLSSTVSTHGSTISSQATALTSLQGSVGTLQSTVSSQGASINSLQTASSTTNGNVATLTTALYAGAPNLLKYGGFQNGLAGWNAAAPWQVSSSLDQNWGRFMTINATGNRYCNTDPQPVQVGQQYTISCDIDRGGTSGGLVAARIIWRNSSGGTLGIGPNASKANGGFSNSEADRVFSSGTCPSGAVDFYVQLVVEGVTGNQYWRRIKVNTGTTPGRYSEEASVVQSFEALSTLTTQYASLSGTVSTLNSSVTTQQTAINNLNGRTSAYWETTAVAGNGRAQLTLHADANGGGGVDIVGDVRISGDTMIGGTLSVSALNYQMFVRRKSGSGSYGGQIPVGTTVLYSESLGQCSPIGSYMLELSGQYSTNAGTRSTTHNGKPLFTSYNADGGIYANLVKNGAVVATVALPVNDTGANTGGTWRVVYTSASLMEKEVTDSSIADVYLQIVAVRGGNDTGIVDDGDTYYRQLSASYSDINVSAKAKWTFI